MDKEIAARYEGTLNDTKVQQMLKDFKPSKRELNRMHRLNIAYVFMNSMQSAVHSNFANVDGTWNGKTVKNVFGDQEIKVGYITGWLNVSGYLVKIFMALSILIILMVAPIFSGEYGGVDNLILTFQYGKTKCTRAKVIAAFSASTLIIIFFVIFNITVAMNNPLYKLFVLMPIYHLQFVSLMSVEQIGQGFQLYAVWAIPSTIIAAIIGEALSRSIFARYQVL